MEGREIKYRAWYNNNMWTVGVIDFANDMVQVAHIVENTKKCYDAEIVFVKDVELMQFTGLHDLNGEEIYEGDVVKCKYWLVWYAESEDGPEHFDRECNSVVTVEYYSNGFTIPVGAGSPEYEILGNKFENPEFLQDVE